MWGLTRETFVGADSPVRAFFRTFTDDQIEAIRHIVSTSQGLNLMAAIGSQDDELESVYYLRKFVRSLEPDQIDRLKQVLTKQQIAAFAALTGEVV